MDNGTCGSEITAWLSASCEASGPVSATATTTPEAKEVTVPASQQPAASFGAIGRQAAFYALGTIIGRAISFVTLPFYTRLLTPAEYGVIQLVLMTFELVAMVAGSRLATGVFRFYHKAEGEKGRYAVLSTATLLISGGYFVAAAVAAIFAEQLSRLVFETAEWAPLLRLASLSFLAQGLLIVPNISFRAFNQPVLYVSRGISQQLLQALLNILFLTVFGMGVYSVFASGAIVVGLYGVVLSVMLLRRTGVRFEPGVARDLIRFGTPMIATQFAVFLMTLGGRYALQHDSGSTAVGLYALAGTFATILVQFGNTPFMLVWESERFKVAENPNRDAIYARAFLTLNFLLFTVAVAIGLLVHDFLRVMATPAYAPAAALVPIMLAAYILQCWTMAQDVGILLTERTRYVAIANWLASGLAVAGFFILIPRYGAFGAAWATCAAFALRWALIYHFSQKLEFVQYRWAPVMKLAVAASIVVGVGYSLPGLPLALSLAAAATLFAAFLAFAWYGRVLAEAERAAIAALMSKLGSAVADATKFARNRA